MAALGLACVVVVVVLIVALGGGSSPTTGYDASYPQCSGSYPSNPLFGIVGVNGGLSNKANPCISGELHWARDAPGQKRPKQPPLSLYIDTANPGGHRGADWPSGGTTPIYAACNGKLTNACSYLYGEQRAAHSYRLVAALDPVGAIARDFTRYFAGDFEGCAFCITPRVESLVRSLVLAIPLPVYRTQRAASPGQYPGLGALIPWPERESAGSREGGQTGDRTSPSGRPAMIPRWQRGWQSWSESAPAC